MSLFARFKEGLTRTTQKIFGLAGNIFGQKKIDVTSLERLEEALYEADFGVETTQEILNEIQKTYKRDPSMRGQDIAQMGARFLEKILEKAEGIFKVRGEKTEVICLIGINGVGKTTTAAKLAHYLKLEGNRVLLGACDTFRAAANEQIKIWADRLDIDLVASQHGADSAAVAYDAYAASKSRNTNVLILDTAGRLHNKSNLMEELKKIRRVLEKWDPEAPQHRWLVVDGSLGSNSIEQAKLFHEKFGLTGLIITKLDGTSRGGAIVGIYRELGIPIYFVGFGEKAEDLHPFSKKDYARAVFGLDA